MAIPFPRSGHVPPQTASIPNAAAPETWWQNQGELITVPRNLCERLRAVHLAQLDDLTRLRIEVAKTRGGWGNIQRIQGEIQAAQNSAFILQGEAATAAKEVASNIETLKLLRYNCVDFEAQLRTLQDRERTLEEHYNAKAAKACENERGSVMHMELSIAGIDLRELRELEIVRLVTRPLREAVAQCLGLERQSTSACRGEQHSRIGLHLHIPKELRAQPHRFREFKQHFVEAKRSGELRTRLEEGLVDLENEFGARVLVKSVSQPILLDGSLIVVPEGCGALGMVPEGHPPGLVTLWQVAPGSWAQKAGIRSGDALVWLNNQPVTEIEVGLLAERIRSRRPLAMYVVRAPGPSVQRAREEAAAKKIQSSFRKRLRRDRGREQRRKMRLIEQHHDAARLAKARDLEKLRIMQSAEVEELVNVRLANRQRMQSALAREDEEQLLEDQRKREKWNEEKVERIKRDQARRVEQRRAERERAAVRIQAGWRGETLRAGIDDPNHQPDDLPVEDPLGRLGAYLDGDDGDVITWDTETNDKKLGFKVKGEPPNEQVFITEISPNGWAERENIQVGDELLMISGQPIHELDVQGFYRALKIRPARLTLTRTITNSGAARADQSKREAAATAIQSGWRGFLGRQTADGRRQDLSQAKVLAERQVADLRAGGGISPGIAPHQWIKVVVAEHIRSMGWTPSGMAPDPMIVEDIVDDSWAQSSRIQIGDELKTIAGMDVSDLDERQVKSVMKQRPLALVFYRREAHDGEAKLLKLVVREDVGKMGWLPDFTDPPRPVMVASVDPSSWAQRQGLVVGDELVKIDGSVVARMTQKDLLRDLKRRPVEIVFKRRPGLKRSVVVDTVPESNDYTVIAYEHDKPLGFVPGGVPPYAVPVDYVEDGSWAEAQGIKKDDLLIAVNGQGIDELDEDKFLEMMRQRPLHLTIAPAELDATGSVAPTPRSKAPDGSGTQFEAVAHVDEGQLGLVPSAMPPNRVYLHSVEPNMWGARQGLRPGDEILLVNGRAIASLGDSEFLRLMADRPLRLVLLRGDGKVPEDALARTGAGVGADEGLEFDLEVDYDVKALGFVVVDATPPEPVIVANVERGTWAGEKGVRPGDQLVRVDSTSVTTMTMEKLGKAMKVRPLRLTFRRYEGQPHEVDVFFTVDGVDLRSLEANPVVLQDFRGEIKATVARESGILPEQVHLVLSDGSVRVHAKIVLPITQAHEVQRRLENSMSLSSNIERGVQAVPGIQASRRGQIVVNGVSVRDHQIESFELRVPAGTDILGFAPGEYPPNPVMIGEVQPGTWAEQNGLLVGHDELVEVDGQSVRNLTQKELLKLMKRRPVKLAFFRHAAPETEDRMDQWREKNRNTQQDGIFMLQVASSVASLGFTPGGFPPDPVTIQEIENGSWAEEQGLLQDADELIAVDGRDVSEMTKKDLIKVMKRRPVALTFQRDSSHVFDRGTAQNENVVVFDLDVDADVGALGFFPADFPPNAVLVESVEPDSWASDNELWAGVDVLIEVGGRPVADMKKKELIKAMKARPVRLTFMRDEDKVLDSDEEHRIDSSLHGSPRGQEPQKTIALDEYDDASLSASPRASPGGSGDLDEQDAAARKIQGAFRKKQDRQGEKKKAEKKADLVSSLKDAVPSDDANNDGLEFDVYADEDIGPLGFDPSAKPPEDVYIDAIKDDSWAEQQGLRVDDWLLKVNDEDVYGMTKKEFNATMRETRPLKLTFWRQNKDDGDAGDDFLHFDGGSRDDGWPAWEDPKMAWDDEKDKTSTPSKDDDWPAWEESKPAPSPAKSSGGKKEKKRDKQKRDSESVFDGLWGALGGGEAENDKKEMKKATATAGSEIDDLGWTLKELKSGKPRSGVVIESVAPYGWAESKKFKVGDVLMMINGKATAEFSSDEMYEKLEDRPLTVTVGRDRKAKKSK